MPPRSNMADTIRRNIPGFDVILIGIVAALTLYFTVETPASDDWDLFPILEKMHLGTLDWKTMDTPYAGHEIPVSYAVMAGVAWVTHWNTYVFRLLNLLILIGAWMAIRPIAVKEGRLAEAAILFWSFNQWACWLWTWMIMSSITMACLLWGMRLLTSGTYRNFVLAMLLGVIATFSWSAGLAFWPAALYMIVFVPRPRIQKAIFALFLAATVLLFLQHPTSSEDLELGKNYFQMPLFFLLALGAPVGFATKDIAAVASLIALLMLILGRPSLETIKSRPFTAGIMLAGLCMMGLLVMVRGAAPPLIYGMDSRYGTMCAVFWVALVLLVDWSAWRKYVLLFLILLCLVRDAAELRAMAVGKQTQLLGVRGIMTSRPGSLPPQGWSYKPGPVRS